MHKSLSQRSHRQSLLIREKTQELFEPLEHRDIKQWLSRSISLFYSLLYIRAEDLLNRIRLLTNRSHKIYMACINIILHTQFEIKFAILYI